MDQNLDCATPHRYTRVETPGRPLLSNRILRGHRDVLVRSFPIDVIPDKAAQGFGGGIEVYGGAATVTNNLIEINRALEAGGGIALAARDRVRAARQPLPRRFP
jgi:hypothetical protein